MRGARMIALGACLAALACDEDPARSMKIVARPPVAASPAPVGFVPAAPAAAVPVEARPADSRPTAAPMPAPDRPAARSFDTPAPPSRTDASGSSTATARSAAGWRPPGCPPPPESSSGPSSLTVDGPCAFQHRSVVACESLDDDFLVTVSRKAAGGTALMVFINVEQYKGPGSYTGAQMFVGLQDKKNIYRWSTDTMNITVGAGEASVTIPPITLEAEPLLVNCTGPMTNFQCEGRGEADEFEKTREVVSGTLRCEMQKSPADSH